MVKKGVVKVESDGKILLEQAVEDWHTKVETHQQRPMNGRSVQSKTIKEQAECYHRARADREVAEAELAEIELSTKNGEVINKTVTKKYLLDAILTTRDLILNVARRVAPELVGVKEESVIIDKLNHELEMALLSLS